MKRFILPLLGLMMLAFISCEDVIQVKLNNKNADLYAVEAKITTADNPTVFFYKALRVDNDGAYTGISGATITVSDNSQPSKSIRLSEDPSKPGFYTVPKNENYRGQIGKEYTVTIEYNGTTLTGKDFLARVEPIDSVKVEPSLRGDKRFLGVFIYGMETPGVGNYYKWDIFINDSLINGAGYMAFASDELVDGNYISGFEIFTDYHDPAKPEERKLKYRDTVVVKQTSLSKQAYYFYYQLSGQSSAGGMFSIPPANIKGNFSSSDGKTVLGIFTAHDVSLSNKAVIDDSIEIQLNERQ
jgi:hypothetical protein